jgi:molybdopterin-containing oxidoreductase family iron-sulfur binding subunit
MIELPIIEASTRGEEPSGTRFWRSLSHLRNDAAFQKLARHEFMPEAMEPPAGASRRQFLQLMGASMAMAGLTACRRPVENILPYARTPEEIIPGIPLNYATSMPFRGSVEALLVESHEGRPTKVEGNPEHPVSQGSSSLFAQASILDLYDPDRSQRVVFEGSGSTWSDFAAFALNLTGGRRVAVLCGETSSPTIAATRQALATRFPQLRWVTYTPEGDDTEQLGLQSAFGRPVRPRYRFSNARVIVSLDADFLGPTARNMVQNTREFAASRRLSTPSDTMSRLFVVESAFSITGGMADNRKRLRSSDIPAFAAALASRLGVGSGGASFANDPFVSAIVADLQQAGGQGVVLAGPTQPPEVHALCAAINSRLGSIGTTVEMLDTGEAPATRFSTALRTLVNDMNNGNVDVLLTLGCNPVYDAPADLGFATAMQGVGTTIHLGSHFDETAAVSRWHLPQSHYLEAWGDGRAYDGTLSVIQPLIAPLYDTRSDVEVLNLLARGADMAGYDLVRLTWITNGVVSGNFEQGWRQALHDGFVPGTAYPAVTAAAAATAQIPATNLAADDLEVVIHLDPKVLDGRYANNPWLQELPDPTTKVVWDNTATMNPATAERLGLEVPLRNGKYFVDRVRLTAAGNTIELPVWVLPGMADNTIAVTLGYGRTIPSNREERHTNFFDRDDYTDIYGHGAIATGVGVNVAPLRTSGAMTVITGVQAERVGGDYLLATIQDHGIIQEEREEAERRDLFRMTTLEEYRAEPGFALDAVKTLPGGEPWTDYPALWEEQHPTDQPGFKDNPYFRNQWAMVIDLNACTGCNVCMVACQSENNIQVVGKDQVSRGRETHWIRIDRYFVSDEAHTDDPMMVMQPVPCMHCENAPCESVCPVAATVHSPDGTNQMIYNRCIGTRYCANNCPYKVRRFNYYNWVKTLPVSVQMAQNPNVTVRSRGVMEKCSYCIQRIRETNKRTNLEGGRPIQDGEVLTACQQACPAQAITFGDQNDPGSAVVRQQQNSRRYEMLAELSVKPRTSYLGRVRNPNPALEA